MNLVFIAVSEDSCVFKQLLHNGRTPTLGNISYLTLFNFMTLFLLYLYLDIITLIKLSR